jgi:hypothetical protein
MQQKQHAFELALDVLTAINCKTHPDRTRVAILRQLAPSLAGSPTEELAREVIEQALAERKRPVNE